jgi:5-methylcytosine-specific restriction enzyme subunit McrC
MNRYVVSEWEALPVADIPRTDAHSTIPRVLANRLAAAARASGLGRANGGTSVLINHPHELRAQQVVGILAAPGVTLEILPKIDALDAGGTRRALVHMLARVLRLKIASSSLAALDWQRQDLLEILIQLFCEHLFAAVHRGLPRRYLGHADDLAVLRGRLDVQRQCSALALQPHKLACRYDALSADIALNQIMRAAVMRLRQLTRSARNQQRLAELAFAFAEISAVPVAMLPWDQVIIDRTNSAWATLLRLAQLLLGARFQSTSAGGECGFALLFQMPSLFEEYIGRTLQQALAGGDLEVCLQGPQAHALVAADGSGRFVTRPDVVIRRGDHPLLVIDTKWKRLQNLQLDRRHGVGQADVYQMLAYLQVYECQRGMLLYPHHAGLEVEAGVLDRYRVTGTGARQLDVATIGLSDLAQVGPQLSLLVPQ